MAARVAINGFGRIGRNILRAIVDSGRSDTEVVAVTQYLKSQELPHRAMEIGIVFECSGYFSSRRTASVHLAAGARCVLASAPVIDFSQDPAWSTVALDQSKVLGGTLERTMSWYDNEWALSNRMNDTGAMMAKPN